jgi:hypothetical protein
MKPTALSDEAVDNLISVIGRGRSGTRMLSHALVASGVYMGNLLNPSGDKVPARKMYDACRLIGRHVDWEGGLSWNFDRLHSMPIDPDFEGLVNDYLADVLSAERRYKGWKLPETTGVFPWIVRMFPEAKYVYIVRDPRDSLLHPHLTDDLRRGNVPCPELDTVLERRVASWKYQYEIVKATPRPQHFVSILYEDLVLDHEATMKRLEAFLGIPLARLVVRADRIGRWKVERDVLPYVEPLGEAMRECGYIGESVKG